MTVNPIIKHNKVFKLYETNRTSYRLSYGIFLKIVIMRSYSINGLILATLLHCLELWTTKSVFLLKKMVAGDGFARS